MAPESWSTFEGICCSYPNITSGYETTYEDSQGSLDVHVTMTHYNIMYLMTSCCLSLILYSS